MTISQKIGKAAEKYADQEFDAGGNVFHSGDIEGAFREGAHWALQKFFCWISSDQEPDTNVPLILKYENGTYEIGYYLWHKRRGYGFYCYPEPDIEFLRTDVVAYRPVNIEIYK